MYCKNGGGVRWQLTDGKSEVPKLGVCVGGGGGANSTVGTQTQRDSTGSDVAKTVLVTGLSAIRTEL